MSTPAANELVTVGKRQHEVVRLDCATNWDQCPHGEFAVTLRPLEGCQLTVCHDIRRLS